MKQINRSALCVLSRFRHSLLIALFLCLAMLPTVVLATTLTIKSDHLDIWEAKQEALFSGSVHLVREDFELFCDSLRVFYLSGKDGGGIDHALAKGHVRIIQGGKEGLSDSAMIDNRKQVVTLLGNAVMLQEGGRVEGESIVHNMAAKTTEVKQGESGRVTLRIDDEKVEDAGTQPAADVEQGQQP